MADDMKNCVVPLILNSKHPEVSFLRVLYLSNNKTALTSVLFCFFNEHGQGVLFLTHNFLLNKIWHTGFGVINLILKKNFKNRTKPPNFDKLSLLFLYTSTNLPPPYFLPKTSGGGGGDKN